MNRGRIAAVTLAAVSLASAMPAAAQRAWMEEPHRTVFEARGWGRAPGADVLDKAATIDWVRLEAVPPPGCPAKDSGVIGWLKRLFGLIKAKLSGGVPPDCHLPDSIQAQVVERLKGQGPRTYRLQEVWVADDRSLGRTEFERETPEGHFGRPTGVYPRYALDRHRGPAYWDHAPTLRIPRGMMLDGPGHPEADVGLRYLVFRDAQGGVLGMEPVASADDDLLARLRTYAKGRPFEAPTWPLADFIRQTRAAAILRVTTCERTPRKALKVGALLVSGDAEATRMSWWPQDQTLPDFHWLGDYLDTTSQACRVGDRLLVLAWTFPEATPNPGFPRAVVIEGGFIRRSALLTGLKLDGPERIPVTQALAWAAEGRRRFGPNIVTPPVRRTP